MTSELLKNILDDLRDDELSEFQWFLEQPNNVQDLPAIPKSRLQTPNRRKTVDVMVQTYGDQRAVQVTKVVLEKIFRKDLLQKFPVSSSGPEAPVSDVWETSENREPSSLQTQPPLPQTEELRGFTNPWKEEDFRKRSRVEEHPNVILAVVAESKERKGISLPAIKKVLEAKKMDVTTGNKSINTIVTKMATNGVLIQTKGTGASGLFKVAKTEPKKVTKKKAPTKAKKPATSKEAESKKTTASKSSKKAAAKEAIKNTPKKNLKKPAARKTNPAAKKPAAKKPAAKKPAKKEPKTSKLAKKVTKKKAPAKAKKRAAKKPAAKKAAKK